VVLNRLLFGQHTEERKVELDLVEDEQVWLSTSLC